MDIESMDIGRWIKECEKLCHDKNCRYTSRCPTFHPKCAQRLGLNTAIVWEARRLLLWFKENDETHDGVIKVAIGVLGLACGSLHYHKELYPKEYKLLQSYYYNLSAEQQRRESK